MSSAIDRMIASLEHSIVIKRGEYDYFIHPVTDGIPQADPEVMDAVAEWMAHLVPEGTDRIVTLEAMGIPLAALVSTKTGIPYVVIRKREYGLEGEVLVEQETGYSSNKLYINSLTEGMNICLVDDVVSTGGSLKAVIPTFRKMGINVNATLIAIEKGQYRKALEQELDLKIQTMVHIAVVDGQVEVLGTHLEQ